MRLLDVGFTLAVAGAVWLRWEPLESGDVKAFKYRTRADTVVCETPFQIRKAVSRRPRMMEPASAVSPVPDRGPAREYASFPCP